MSKVLFDFLAESRVFDEGALETEYSELDDEELELELSNYREHVLANAEELERSLVPEEDSLSVYFDTAGRDGPPEELLKQCVLYYDRLVLDDPVFEHTRAQSELQEGYSHMLGFEPPKIDRKAIARSARRMKLLTPLVAAGLGRIAPFRDCQ